MSGVKGHRLDGLKARMLLVSQPLGALAKAANLNDFVLQEIVAGGTCEPEVTQRILDALIGQPITITSSSIANPTTITCATHSFQTGDTVTIAGHVTSVPSLNGVQVVTRVNATSFTIPVNVTTGGTGGTATPTAACLGQVSQS